MVRLSLAIPIDSVLTEFVGELFDAQIFFGLDPESVFDTTQTLVSVFVCLLTRTFLL